MKKLIFTTTVVAALMGNSAHAEVNKPDNELTFNAALSSDYRYRGISQSRLKPALSGGADYTNNPTGFYVGAWASTIKWTKDAGGGGDIELDIFAGKRGEIVKDVSYDVGVLTYIYPSNDLNPKADTTEIYGQVGFGPAYAKYSHSLTNTFGFVDSKNSGYLDLGANIDIAAGTQLNLHAGHQKIRNSNTASYTDWKIGATKDFGFANISASVIGTNTSTYTGPAPELKNLGKTALVVAISKIF